METIIGAPEVVKNSLPRSHVKVQIQFMHFIIIHALFVYKTALSSQTYGTVGIIYKT